MRSLNFSPFIAALTAGPVFVISAALALLYLELPRPIEIDASQVAGFALILPVAAVVSVIVALGPAFMATQLLAALGEIWAPARQTGFWVATGTALGVLLGWLLVRGAWVDEIGAFPWVVASAWTAWRCRRGVEWD